MKIKHCWNCGIEVPYIEYDNINYIPKCKECGVLYPEKPKDEALLSIYQEEYLNDKSDENLSRLFELLKKVTFNVIRYKLKSKSSYEQIDEIWDKVQWSLEKLLMYYKEKPDFKITTSFVQYIKQVVLFPLYNKVEKERQKKEISIYTPKFKNSDKNSKELCDYLSKSVDGGLEELENEMDYDTNKNGIIGKSVDFIKDVALSIYEYDGFKNCIYMLLLYKFFISGESDDVLVRKITDSLDYSLVNKFEESKNLYREILINYSSDGA